MLEKNTGEPEGRYPLVKGIQVRGGSGGFHPGAGG